MPQFSRLGMEHHPQLSGYVGQGLYVNTHWLVSLPLTPKCCVCLEDLTSVFSWSHPMRERRQGMVLITNRKFLSMSSESSEEPVWVSWGSDLLRFLYFVS